MVYNALISSFDQNDFKKHQIISKTLVGKDVKYVTEDRASSKDKKGMKFVEIIHTLRKECIEKEFRENFQVRREPLANIVRHMKEQKENKSKLCCVINGICNFLSRIQNAFSGYGFKTSVEMAIDLLTGLELPKVTDLKTLIEQLKKYTTLDHAQLDQIKEPKDLKLPLYSGNPLLNQLLESPNSVDPSWIEFISSLDKDVINLKSSRPAIELQPLHILFRSIKGFGQPHENKLIQKMVDCGANINAIDLWGGTPLSAALSKQLPFDIVKLFINKESANAIKDGQTPIRFLETRKTDFYRGEKREDLEKILEALKKAASEGQSTPTQPSPVTPTQEQLGSKKNEEALKKPASEEQSTSTQPVIPYSEQSLPHVISPQEQFGNEKNVEKNAGEGQSTSTQPVIPQTEQPLPSVTQSSLSVSKEINFDDLMAILPRYMRTVWSEDGLKQQTVREELARSLIVNMDPAKVTLETLEQCLTKLITLGININAESPIYSETILDAAITKLYNDQKQFSEQQTVKFFKFLLAKGAVPKTISLLMLIDRCKNDSEVLKLLLNGIDDATRAQLKSRAILANNTAAQAIFNTTTSNEKSLEERYKKLQESLHKFVLEKKLPFKDFTKDQQNNFLFLLPTLLLAENIAERISIEHACKWIDLLADMGFEIGNAKLDMYESILIFIFDSFKHSNASPNGEMIIGIADQTTFIQTFIDKGVDIKSDTIIERAVKYCNIPVIIQQILSPTTLDSIRKTEGKEKELLRLAISYKNETAKNILGGTKA